MAAHDSESGENQAPREERVAIVEEHIKRDNQHEVEGVMEMFGENPWFQDEGQGEHHEGFEGVREHY